MLDFQNRAMDTKLLKFTQIKTKELTVKNMISNINSFQDSEIVIGFMVSKWVWGGDLDFDFECRLALHAKRDTIKLTFFTVFLEKRDFLQMTSNIGKLYTVENHFLPQLTIWDRYLK